MQLGREWSLTTWGSKKVTVTQLWWIKVSISKVMPAKYSVSSHSLLTSGRSPRPELVIVQLPRTRLWVVPACLCGSTALPGSASSRHVASLLALVLLALVLHLQTAFTGA